MPTTHGPAGPRRRLGAELRRLRNRAHLHLDEVSRELECSPSKISRLENGKGIPKKPDVVALMRIYGVTAQAESEMLLRLVHESRETGWWEEFVEGVQPERYVMDAPGRYPALESEAIEVRSFSTTLLHGLIQTREYARGVLTEMLPDRSRAEIENLVALREQRKRALVRADAPLRLYAIVDEGLLCRTVTSPAVMAEQLRQLEEVGRLPNVRISVLPFASGFHRALAGQFTILELAEPLGTVVYIEGHSGEAFLDGHSDVETYRSVYSDASERALDREASAALIRQRRRSFAP